MLKLLLLAAGALASQVPLGGTGGADSARSVQLDITPYLNAKATSANGESDGKGFRNGSTFPSEFLPQDRWTDSGVAFALPDWSGARDCIKSDGQVLTLPDPAEVRSIHLVGAGEDAGGFLNFETREALTLAFADGGTLRAPFEVKHWWSHHWTNKSPIRAPYHFAGPGQRNYNTSHLFHIPVAVPPAAAGRTLTSVRLPPPAEKNALKVFAVSYVPVPVPAPAPAQAEAEAHNVAVPWARGTRRWENGHQIVEVLVANPRSAAEHGDRGAWARDLSVELHGASFTARKPVRVNRIMPGDEVLLEFEVEPTASSESFDDARVVVCSGASSRSDSIPVTVADVRLLHSPAYTEAEVEEHSRPRWYDRAKFGIFIHWGLFSVPAFAAPPQYAEWYDFWLHDGERPTETHHRETYGPEFNYDDFIPMFTAEQYNASEWMDVIAASGAKYFVFTTKHHDGFAMFDTKDTSDRNSLLLGPRRDILAELMAAAREEHPEIKRGTYFSLPEWFNPLYAPHGRLSFPGGPALNPFTRAEEPFTGLRDVGDFIEGLQRPQMDILTRDYDVDLLWCDIGLDNHSSAVFSEWYAAAAAAGREVAVNNRCGVGGDFDTPEMTRFATVQPRKWETCASMDPHSFGYNAATRDDEYRTAADVVTSLVDIVAKGGNFLLNIGPRADGSIPRAQSEPLREAGRWLATNGRAIFGTTPFEPYPEHNADGVHVEFTRTPDAFYIISLNRPAKRIAIPAPLPVLPGDTVVAITPGGDKTVGWSYDGGTLTLDTSGVEFAEDGIAWVFEVQYASGASEPVHDEL